jgi:hypothetical protein
MQLLQTVRGYKDRFNGTDGVPIAKVKTLKERDGMVTELLLRPAESIKRNAIGGVKALRVLTYLLTYGSNDSVSHLVSRSCQ